MNETPNPPTAAAAAASAPHSPLPWTCDTCAWPIYVQSDVDKDADVSRMVAVVHSEGDGFDTGYKHFPADEAEANARLIVEAVNAHARYRRALQLIAADADALNAQEIRETALEALAPPKVPNETTVRERTKPSAGPHFRDLRLPPVDAAERATILAALRYYREAGMGEPDCRPLHIHEIATLGGALLAASLDASAIEALYERISEPLEIISKEGIALAHALSNAQPDGASAIELAQWRTDCRSVAHALGGGITGFRGLPQFDRAAFLEACGINRRHQKEGG